MLHLLCITVTAKEQLDMLTAPGPHGDTRLSPGLPSMAHLALAVSVFPLRLLSNDIGQDILSVERDHTTVRPFIYPYPLYGTLRPFSWAVREYWTPGAS